MSFGVGFGFYGWCFDGVATVYIVAYFGCLCGILVLLVYLVVWCLLGVFSVPFGCGIVWNCGCGVGLEFGVFPVYFALMWGWYNIGSWLLVLVHIMVDLWQVG